MATTTPATTAAEAGTGTDERIARDRERIDELDRRLIALVRERMEVSARVQRARIGAGGRRVNLSREMEVLTRYRERLGRPGTSLAMTLLELCRGRV
ncbi:chorismate mutase [Streptomyces sp. CNQ085]|uniref:chorismate mutase n=1 Tax=Streptomyces sp. CNQ085 TaxID=2886944 RepID=UPI001F50D466|nr:chorismate mutase [Streptomyces sp. CNQ085]MCI0385330.1 chorismate mutase [Streptomyces sp. CNQ085]